MADGYLSCINGAHEVVEQNSEPESATEDDDTVNNNIQNENKLDLLEIENNTVITMVCAVCEQAIQNNLTAVQPCKCGSYVHPDCLLTLIQNYEETHPGCGPLGCFYCSTLYNVTSDKDLTLMALDEASHIYGQLCKFGCQALAVLVADFIFTINGLNVLVKLYGLEVAKDMVFLMHPIEAAAVCKCIPLITVVLNFIPWEGKLLNLLRWCSQLPLVGRFFPSLHPRVREKKDKTSLVGGFIGGLLLPNYAIAVGDILFSAVQSPVSRTLLGAAAFLGAKGTLLMYCKQKLYSRQAVLTVEPHHEE